MPAGMTAKFSTDVLTATITRVVVITRLISAAITRSSADSECLSLLFQLQDDDRVFALVTANRLVVSRTRRFWFCSDKAVAFVTYIATSRRL